MASPVLQALLVADQVYQDVSTGKFVICGIFGTIFYVPKENEPFAGSNANDAGEGGSAVAPSGSSPSQSQMPITRLVRAGSPSAYVSLTEVQGHRKFELRYVDLEENNVKCARPEPTYLVGCVSRADSAMGRPLAEGSLGPCESPDVIPSTSE